MIRMNAKQLLIRLFCALLLSCVLFGCTPEPKDGSGTETVTTANTESDSDAYTGDGVELPEIPFH